MFKRVGFTLLIISSLFNYLYADQGGIDGSGYMWTNSRTATSPSVTYEWIDVQDGTAAHSGAFNDAVSAAVSLPAGFDFYFYGKVMRTAYISTNGWISFVDPSGTSYPANTTIPSGAGPDSSIAVFWDNLSSNNSNNGIFYKTVGVAPNRKFVVEWYITSPNQIGFEVVLYEHSDIIKFQYKTLDASWGGGQSATIGIKADNATGLEYSFDTAGSVANFDAILFHNEITDGADAEILPKSAQASKLQTFNYIISNIDPTGITGLGKLDRIAVDNPFAPGSSPTVTGVKINTYNAFIQNSSDKPENPGYATWQYINDSIVVQTSDFDIVDSVKIAFMQTLPSGTSTANSYVSSYNAAKDASATKTSTEAVAGDTDVEVVPGDLASITIRDAAGGGGNAVTTASLTTDGSLTYYAAGYDADGNYIADQLADWTTTGSLDAASSTGTTSFTFNPASAPTSGTIEATFGAFSDATGVITVSEGVLAGITIRDAAGGGGNIVTTASLTTDGSLTYYAAGYDADGNYIADQLADWTTTGSLDVANSAGTTSFTFDPSSAPTSGTIEATFGAFSDATGVITVSEGALASITIRDAAGGGSNAVTTASLTTDGSLTYYAAGYDADGNYIADQLADWTTTGSLDVANSAG
ncbi:MAG: hypothetical protein AB7T22_10935, partial [Calditrichaceae bacterium]